MISLYGVRVSAPGKVILHGEHSVLYDKFAIAASLGLRTSLVIQETNPSSNVLSVHIDLPCVHLKCILSLDEIRKNLFEPFDSRTWREPKALDHEYHLRKVDNFFQIAISKLGKLNSVQTNAIRCFLYILSGIFGGTNILNRSFNVIVDSSLTVGAGTGSSASFAVCLSAALIQLMKLKTGNKDRQFKDDDKALISAWAYNCEKIMHGTPSGIDNATCTYGSLVGFKKGEEPKLSSFKTNLRILLVDTRVSRQTKILVAKVATLWEQNKLAVNSIMDACGHIATSAYEIMEKLSASDCENSEALFKQLSDLWNMNHCLLASLGVSNPALEDIRSLAALYDLACKLTGAGGGGYAIILIPPTVEQKTVDSLRSHFECRGYTVKDTLLGGPGVTLDEIILRRCE
ncbi:mevalonate kinase-like [Melitaea cinxia]|uniref:mevalonate kinase-like n=1 Tax=Melitaea cinxia TaxID=113334 RepID=UPI001E26F814|nr:mevalonate kinase-like [Melitaea cinxia]XP_045454059.1 mevalonate kinase-like [Melitaea cinxia]